VPSCSSCAFDAATDEQQCPRCGSILRDPLVGTVLGDRYRILSRIGVGGMGAVYRAEHTMMKREVAVKVLLPEFGGRDEFARRFEREAQSASRLAHPNIITVTDFGRTADGSLFLAMELLAGHSLTSVIKAGPLPRDRALAIARQMLDALEHAHGAGVVHRDLKPDNIMLLERSARADIVKILDFGIAKVSEPASGREALTQAGVIFGTPDYLSPEQALGEPVDARADIYAAGVILFEMLTGRRPYESEDKVRIISMHLSHPLPRMRDVSPAVDVPLPIEQAVLQALEKQREHRFASAAAFQAALEDAEAVVAASPAMAGGAGSDEGGAGAVFRAASAAGPWLRQGLTRHRRAVAAAVAGVVLIAAGITLGVRKGAFPGGSGALSGGRAPRPAPLPPALVGEIRRAEGLLAAGELLKARLALEQLLSEHPQSARVRYLLGRLAFADDRHGEALDAYREAIALDAGFRGDPVLIEHLGVALGEPRIADEALDLAVDRVGRPAVALLERVANEGNDVDRRRRAAEALDDLGEGKRVDRVELRIAELRKAELCEEKKPLVIALGDSGDLRALPALRAQRPRGGLSRLLGADSDVSCMKDELAAAITKLEAKLPPEQRSNQRATARRFPFGRGR
jgi:serine/threonine-protein kinase